jgi:hypothetical protein
VAVWIRRADWPLDDGGIVYHERHDTTGYDIFRFDFRSNAARRLAATKYEEAQGQIDRDGRCAYISDEAGRMNVYVRLSIDDSRAERISPDGGWDPRWREDGGELFYVSDSHLMSVEMPRGQIRPGRVTRLFPLQASRPRSPFSSNYVPTRDGRFFLVRVPLELPETRPIMVTLNWLRRVVENRRAAR